LKFTTTEEYNNAARRGGHRDCQHKRRNKAGETENET